MHLFIKSFPAWDHICSVCVIYRSVMNYYKEVWNENIDSWVCWQNYDVLQNKGQNFENHGYSTAPKINKSIRTRVRIFWRFYYFFSSTILNSCHFPCQTSKWSNLLVFLFIARNRKDKIRKQILKKSYVERKAGTHWCVILGKQRSEPSWQVFSKTGREIRTTVR